VIVASTWWVVVLILQQVCRALALFGA
jgi:hypothetical protein